MQNLDFLKKLEVPNKKIDVVLDTDTYNEVDDQFALAYLLRSEEKLTCRAIYAAPFKNSRSTSPADGMEKSYQEIFTFLQLCERMDMEPNVYRGSTSYLPDEETPVISDAASDLVARSKAYTSENPLYVVAIGAITNVASAILMDPSIIERTVVVWLGGHSLEWENTREFNMMQDIAAARVVMGCGVPLVMLPCMGVVSEFACSIPELKYWLSNKNPLCDKLVEIVENYVSEARRDKVWSKVIWDVTAVAWLLNDDERFMRDRLIHAPIPEYDHHYARSENRHFVKYVWSIKRDLLFEDLFEKLAK